MIKILQKEYLSAGTLTSTIRTFSKEEKTLSQMSFKTQNKATQRAPPSFRFSEKKLPMYAKLWYRSTGKGGLGLVEEHEKLTHTTIYTNAL